MRLCEKFLASRDLAVIFAFVGARFQEFRKFIEPELLWALD